MARQSGLTKAKNNKKDEFYTQLKDIEKELVNYKSHFENKTIYCNCDDPLKSNFFKYFFNNFEELKLRKIICSCYKDQAPAYYITYEGGFNGDIEDFRRQANLTYFQGNGDFRSEESLDLLRQSNIVVTNPPFSLFRSFVDQLIKNEKQFLIIGNVNCLTYKEIFALFKDNRAWLGTGLGRWISGFIVPDHYELYGTETSTNENGEKIIATNNCLWLTNLDHNKRHEFISLDQKYTPEKYPKYDNFNGINVNRTELIPCDYDGFMGVPLTFMDKYNPEQFEIIKFRKGDDENDLKVNGKNPYFRIIIKKR